MARYDLYDKEGRFAGNVRKRHPFFSALWSLFLLWFAVGILIVTIKAHLWVIVVLVAIPPVGAWWHLKTGKDYLVDPDTGKVRVDATTGKVINKPFITKKDRAKVVTGEHILVSPAVLKGRTRVDPTTLPRSAPNFESRGTPPSGRASAPARGCPEGS